MSTPIVLSEQTQQFIAALHRGGVHRFTQELSGKYPVTYWSKVNEPLRLPPNFEGAAIYFGINPTIVRVTDEDRTKYPRFGDAWIEKRVASKDRTIACINCLYREYDGKDFADNEEAFRSDIGKYKELAKAHVLSLSPAPSVVVDSGGGYQCYWMLDETFYLRSADDRTRAKDIQRRWVEMDKHADQQVKDIRRIFRIPGTINYKDVYAPHYPTVQLLKKDL
jgi:hypothetical protein